MKKDRDEQDRATERKKEKLKDGGWGRQIRTQSETYKQRETKDKEQARETVKIRARCRSGQRVREDNNSNGLQGRERGIKNQRGREEGRGTARNQKGQVEQKRKRDLKRGTGSRIQK